MRQHRVLRFASAAVAPDTLLPTAVSGEERISTPTVFTIDLAAKADGPDIDPAALLAETATLEILQGAGSRHAPTAWRPIRGVLREFAETGHGHDWIRYRAVLVADIWPLSLSRRTKVHQHRAVPDLVKDVLSAHRISGKAVELNLRGRYAEREYVLQYQEDDLSFICRLLEHEGISWYQRHDAGATVLVLTDHADGWATVPGDAEIPFRPRHGNDDGEAAAAQDWYQQEVIDELARVQRLVAGSYEVRDWNYRTPGSDLTAKVQVGNQAVAGPTSLFGEHHKDAGEAGRIAGLRAEELRCRQAVFQGGGDQRGFRCGHRFTLESHPRPAFAQEYLLVAVHHDITQALEGGSGSGASTHYENRFTALPAGQVYRPELRTPRPIVPGVLNARIDAAGDGTYAELDDTGRYHVKLLADTAEAAPGGGSRAVRMAQPSTGADHGFHLPLHKESEVLLVHVGGDPDRPIIAGTVPNPDTPSVVVGANQTQSVWRSAGANEVRFEDLKGKEEVFLHASRDRRVEVVHDDQTTVGNDQRLTVRKSQTVKIATTCHLAIGAAYQISVGAAMNESVGASKSEEVGAAKYETVAGERTLDVGKDFAVKVGAEHREQAVGKRLVKAKAVLIEAEDEITLRCGKASLTLTRSGDIRIEGKDVLVKASGKLAGKAAGDLVLKGAKSADN